MDLLITSVVLINILFISSAFGKINNFNGTVNSLKSVFWIKKLPLWFFQLAIAGVIVLLICAPSVMLYSVFNPKYNMFARFACYALIAFTLLASLLYHMPTDPSQRINFMKNMSIIGGFLALSMCF
jgi:putative oxidoreductase